MPIGKRKKMVDKSRKVSADADSEVRSPEQRPGWVYYHGLCAICKEERKEELLDSSANNKKSNAEILLRNMLFGEREYASLCRDISLGKITGWVESVLDRNVSSMVSIISYITKNKRDGYVQDGLMWQGYRSYFNYLTCMMRYSHIPVDRVPVVAYSVLLLCMNYNINGNLEPSDLGIEKTGRGTYIYGIYDMAGKLLSDPNFSISLSSPFDFLVYYCFEGDVFLGDGISQRMYALGMYILVSFSMDRRYFDYVSSDIAAAVSSYVRELLGMKPYTRSFTREYSKLDEAGLERLKMILEEIVVDNVEKADAGNRVCSCMYKWFNSFIPTRDRPGGGGGLRDLLNWSAASPSEDEGEQQKKEREHPSPSDEGNRVKIMGKDEKGKDGDIEKCDDGFLELCECCGVVGILQYV